MSNRKKGYNHQNSKNGIPPTVNSQINIPLKPKKDQYKNWSLPSKLTYWGFWVGMLSIIINLIQIVLNIFSPSASREDVITSSHSTNRLIDSTNEKIDSTNLRNAKIDSLYSLYPALNKFLQSYHFNQEKYYNNLITKETRDKNINVEFSKFDASFNNRLQKYFSLGYVYMVIKKDSIEYMFKPQNNTKIEFKWENVRVIQKDSSAITILSPDINDHNSINISGLKVTVPLDENMIYSHLEFYNMVFGTLVLKNTDEESILILGYHAIKSKVKN